MASDDDSPPYDDSDMPPPEEDMYSDMMTGEDLPPETPEELRAAILDLPDFTDFAKSFEDEMARSVGYASRNVEILALMKVHDPGLFDEVNEVIKRCKVATTAGKAVRERAEQLSHAAGHMHALPPGQKPYVKLFYSDAPVPAKYEVPNPWVMVPKNKSGHQLCKIVQKKVNGMTLMVNVPVSIKPLLITKVLKDKSGENGDDIVELAWRNNSRWAKGAIYRSQMVRGMDLAKSLSDSGANSTNANGIVEYLAMLENTNEENIEYHTLATAMGWTACGGAVVGDEYYAPTSVEKTRRVTYHSAGAGEKGLVRLLGKSRGMIDKWVGAIAPAMKFPAIEMGLYASLASPFLEILQCPGFTVDFCHKTSGGKSTLLRLAASAWGPAHIGARESLIHSWSMTRVGFERRAASLNSLPFFVDETKLAEDYGKGGSFVSKALYQHGDGSNKTRGNTSGGSDETLNWRSVLMTTGESRAIDLSQDGGTVARVLTIWGAPFGGKSDKIAALIDEVGDGVAENYGHAGKSVFKWLVENPQERPRLKTRYRKLSSEFRLRIIEHCRANGAAPDLGAVVRISLYMAVIQLASEVAHDVLPLTWAQGDYWDKLIPSIASAVSSVDRARGALEDVISWAAANRARFCYSEVHRQDNPPHQGWLGYWQYRQSPRTGGNPVTHHDWRYIGFWTETLSKFLADQGHEPRSIVRQWREAGWLKTSGKGNFSIEALDGRPRMITVTREAAISVGGLSAEPENHENDEQEPIPF